MDWVVLFVLCYTCFVGYLLQLKVRNTISFTPALAALKMCPVIQPSCAGCNTMCQAKVCVLGESLPMRCFHLCSQQGDQTEEWDAELKGKKRLWEFIIFVGLFFFHRENKKRKGSPLGKQLY